MALALALLSLLTLVGLALSTWSGWLLSHGGSPSPALGHVALAIPTVLFSLFTQSMVLFFFIGTGKLLKEAAKRRPDAEGRDFILARVREFKVRTSGLATLAPLSALLAGLLGAAAQTGRAPGWVHLAAVVATLVLHLMAFGREVVAMAETNQLMEEADTLVPPSGVHPSSPLP